ncbi:hypothetical protein NL676_012762 [Syzygium grande]|nr:hypothetical protein NL676_012762 [Syzygium grande]
MRPVSPSRTLSPPRPLILIGHTLSPGRQSKVLDLIGHFIERLGNTTKNIKIDTCSWRSIGDSPLPLWRHLDGGGGMEAGIGALRAAQVWPASAPKSEGRKQRTSAGGSRPSRQHGGWPWWLRGQRLALLDLLRWRRPAPPMDDYRLLNDLRKKNAGLLQWLSGSFSTS